MAVSIYSVGVCRGCQYIFSRESVVAVSIYSVGVCRGCQYIFSRSL